MIGPGEREICTILQAAARVGVSRRTIYNWIAAGRIEVTYLASGAPRIFVDTLYRAQARPKSRGSAWKSSAETPSSNC